MQDFPDKTWHRSNWISLALELLRVVIAAFAGFGGGQL